jgi:hypothetical protein
MKENFIEDVVDIVDDVLPISLYIVTLLITSNGAIPQGNAKEMRSYGNKP